MQKIRPLKIPYWSSLPLYVKIIVIVFILFVFVSFVLQKTIRQQPSSIDYESMVQKILSIKTQIQDIAFLVPDTTYSQDRKTLKNIVQQEIPILESINETLLTLQFSMDNISTLSAPEQDSLYNAYNIINTSIKKTKNSLESLQNIPEFSDISSYIQELQKVSRTLANFPEFYHSQPLAIKHFSLRKS